MEPKLLNVLSRTRAFLFDLDGTVFLDDHLLPGAAELLAALADSHTPFFFLTNNSSRSVSDYAGKLRALGLPFGEERIFSSGMATALYLKKRQPGARLFVVGTPSLEAEFSSHGFVLDDRAPAYAVLGFDTTLTYEKLRKFCDILRAGVPYIATHPDVNCPTADGFIPDIGSFIAMITASTGREPDIIIGKPHAPIVEAVAELTGLPLDSLVMIGDRLYTDIALGRAGLRTILVLTGETKEADLLTAPFVPDAVAADLVDVHAAWVAAHQS